MSAGASDLNAAPESRDLRVDESGTLSWNETRFPCALGQGGVRRDKIEGDGATPLGMFPLRRVLYRHRARRYLWRPCQRATAGATTPRIRFTIIRSANLCRRVASCCGVPIRSTT